MLENTNSAFPPVLGLDGLSVLLHKAPSSILADRCRAPHRLPPACTPPGCKQPLWLTADVLAWLTEFKETPCAIAENAPTRRAPGRPRKVDQVAAARVAAKAEG